MEDFRGKKPKWTEQERAARRRLWWKRYNDKRRGEIRDRSKDRHLKRAYGISGEEKASMLRRQCGVCAMCGADLKTGHVDHNHKTGKVRGVLCGPCNRALGFVEKYQEAAQAYLRKYDG